MPIYEYQCQSCGHELEKLQRMNDDALTDCPECGKSSLKRLISAAAFRLKGSGWYETDFKKDNRRNLVDTGGDSGSTATTSGSDSAKETASKPDIAPAKTNGGDAVKESSKKESTSAKPAEKSTKASSAPASS